MSTAVVPATERLTVSVPEFARAVGIGRNSAYGLMREGRVRHLRVGSRILIPVSAIHEFLEG